MKFKNQGKNFLLFALIIIALLLVFNLVILRNKSGQHQKRIDRNKRQIKTRQVYNFKTPARNYQRIQFGDFRKNFDKPYNRLADELSDTYYNFWKKGKNKLWQGYGVQPTLEQSKKLFDELHGLIWHWYNVNFYRANMSRPINQRIPEAQYNYVYGPGGKVLYKKSEHSMKIIEDLKKQGIQITIK